MEIHCLDHQIISDITYYSQDSPVGMWYFGVYDNLLVSMHLHKPEARILSVANGLSKQIADQIQAYFQGDLSSFELQVGLSGTKFDQQVLTYVAEIPFGEQWSYKDIALKFEDANLSRAVGSANGRNKILLVIPCHRVVGANGDLTGYAGGLPAKKWLLDFEKRKVSNQLSIF